jgi:ATP-dependent protease ClpP protease subunit
MGSLLLAGGEKGHRYVLKNGSVMIHRTSSFLPSILESQADANANGQNHQEEHQAKLPI